MFKGGLKKWVVVSVSVLTILLTIVLGYTVIESIRIILAGRDSWGLLVVCLFYFVFVTPAVYYGITTIITESLAAAKAFCAWLVTLVTICSLYEYNRYISSLFIPPDGTSPGIIFFIVGFIPIILGILAYKILVRLISNKNSAIENETGSETQ